MKGTFYFSYFCLGHFLVLFSFLLLQLNIFLQSLTSSSISFQIVFTLNLSILLCCLRVWVESSCQRSNFDSFKWLTSPPEFCSVSLFLFIPHLILSGPLPECFVLFCFRRLKLRKGLHIYNPSLPIHLQQQPSLWAFRFGNSHR